MRIALIHAVQLAIDPVAKAFKRHWPEADPMHLLDDTLSRDRAAQGKLTNAMAARIEALARYGVQGGADAILYTCSAFGPAIRSAAHTLDLPVMTPNEAMFTEAAEHGGKVGLLATFEPSVPSMAEEYAEVNPSAPLHAVCVPTAMQALTARKMKKHDDLLAEAAKRQMQDCDVIMLAQFSTARAKTAVAKATGVLVLTSPDSAVQALHRRLANT